MKKKKIIAAISFAAILYSNFSNFFSMPGIGNELLTSEIGAASTILTMSLLYLYATCISKKWLFYISSFAILGLSIYTYWLFFDVVELKFVTLGLGFYLLLIGNILVFLNLFIKENKISQEEKKETKNDVLEQLKMKPEEKIKYVTGFYIYGVTKLAGMKPCTVGNDLEHGKIIVLIADKEDVIRREFSYGTIHNCKIKTQALLKQDSVFAEDHTAENTVLIAALFGGVAASLIGNMGAPSDTYQVKTKINVIYQIEFEYMEDTVPKKMLLEVSQNPEELFQSVLSKELI